MELHPYLALDEYGNPMLVSASISMEDAIDLLSTFDSSELVRRNDVVRDLAREFEEFSDQDIRERLRGITNRQLDSTEITQFRQDVRAQVLDDLVDILNWSHLGRLRSRRTIRITAPKGYLRKTFNSLSTEEIKSIEDRLRARQWGDLEIETLRARRG